MITGFNTDVEHAGTTYHVQTEDKGLKTPLILSLVYVGGTILASKRTSYQDLVEVGFEETTLVERLQRQHKLLCAAIRAGRIEDLKRMSADAREAAHASNTEAASSQAEAAPSNIEVAPSAVSTDASPVLSTGAPPAASLAPPPPATEKPAPPPVTTPPVTTPPVTTPPPVITTTTPVTTTPQAQATPPHGAPFAAKKPPASLDEIEIIPVTDPSFEAVSVADASLETTENLETTEKAAPVEAPTGVDAPFEFIPANDASFLPPVETLPPPSPQTPQTPQTPPATHDAQANGDPGARAPETPEATWQSLREAARRAEATATTESSPAPAPPRTPTPAPVVDAGHDALYVSLLDDEGEFRAGELVTIRIYVGLGQYGQTAVGDASVTVKILGTTFRPLILSTKTSADGTAIVRALLPRFTSGRAAILIRARAGEQDAELRRIIHHT